MALIQAMLTIRGKAITGVLALILIIQLISSGFQYMQTRTILMDEFLIGSQNLAEPLIVSLDKQLQDISASTGEIQTEEMASMLDAYVKITGIQEFEAILNSKKELQSIKFVNVNGITVVESKRGEENKIETVMAEEDEQASGEAAIEDEQASGEAAIDAEIQQYLKAQKLTSVESGAKMDIFIPFKFQENFLGGFILSHNNQRVNAIKNRIWMISLILLVIYMAVAFTVVFVFSDRWLKKPVNKMISVMQGVARGDLENELEIKNKDEIAEIQQALNGLIATLKLAFLHINNVMGAVEKGNLSQQISIDLEGAFNNLKNSVNQSVQMLGETISQVATICDQVNVGSSELSRVSAEISNNTNVMASTLEQISSSMYEIEKNTKDNSANSSKAQSISSDTLELVNRGNSQMESMMSSINKINKTSMDVSKIIKAIDEIAFQTNLLALNAAVEAARAGKYGKGFAVVAEEVRNLAARSANAAKDTTELIENSIKEVKQGVENAEKTGSLLTEITESVKESNQLMNQIADASMQQDKGISEINVGVSQINDMVQKNSAVAEETASSSEQLSGQAADLQKLIQQFTLLEYGS